MNKILVLLLVIVLLTVSVSAQDAEWELTETQAVNLSMAISNYRFNIPYPTGWFTDKDFLAGESRQVSVITEFEEDGQQVFDGTYELQGYVIFFDRLDEVALVRHGYPRTGATLEDLAAAVVDLYEYQEPTEISEVTAMWQTPALSLRTVDGMGNAVTAVMGISTERAWFMFGLVAPSEEALDAFLPTWEAMLASIEVEAGYSYFGDYPLYLDCRGSGSPTVILEPNVPGMGYSFWTNAHRNIAAFTRVCIHDWPQKGDEVRTFHDFVIDIHDLLAAAGVEGPYVLVGPWVGGLIALVYVDTYPDEAVGLVLVDSFHPNSWAREVEYNLEIETISDEEIEGAWEDIRAYWATWGLDYDASIAEAAAVNALGDLPLAVITPELMATGVVSEYDQGWQTIWLEEFQPALAALSTNSTLTVLEGVYHYVTPQQPEVVDAIRQMVEEWRAEEDE